MTENPRHMQIEERLLAAGTRIIRRSDLSTHACTPEQPDVSHVNLRKSSRVFPSKSRNVTTLTLIGRPHSGHTCPVDS